MVADEAMGPSDEPKPEPRLLREVRAMGVAKMFGQTPALRGVSLTATSGTMTLLSGPNGAGKSTLLSIVGTQLRPTRGSVEYELHSGAQLSRRAARAHLGWVSHESHCYGELTGRQNVELAAEVQGVDKSRYVEVAQRVGLGRFAERKVNTLSRGQRQRVALARALIHRPSLLLLDEPWTGLDAASSDLLVNIVQEEAKAGAIVLLVSHTPGLAARLGAREVQLVRGTLG